jgi:hypothetical protein
MTITEPTVPMAQKRTIYLQAREHAYETFSSFAMEGLLEFLLLDAAAEFRRQYRIVLHPMTNVDGSHKALNIVRLRLARPARDGHRPIYV